MPEVPVTFQSYQSRSERFSNQRLVNMFAESGSSGTKTPLILYNRPGLTTFTTLGAGPINGIETMKGVPFVVSGEELYSFSEDGASTLIGQIAGSGNVSMANNGRQVAIARDGKGYIAQGLDSGTISGFSEIEAQNVNIESISDNGSGIARFKTTTAHGLLVGEVVNHTLFNTSSYNGDFTISAIISSTEYDISSIIFVGNETATNNIFSLYTPMKDFNTLAAAGNDLPNSLWSDGTTMWVSHTPRLVVNSSDAKLYAYSLATKARDAGKDFNTLAAAGNTGPVGLWSDGTTMWVADANGGKLYAYSLATKARDAGKDFNTLAAAGNTGPRGLWSDGTTMWVADTNRRKLYAYNLATKARDAGKDFNTLAAAGNTGPVGLWSDGTTMWVADLLGGKLYAYSLVETQDIPISSLLIRSSKTQIESNQNGLNEGQSITITGTENYNGSFLIYDVNLNTFKINKVFLRDETGAWEVSSSVVRIDDSDFPTVSDVVFQKGYFIWAISNSGQFQLSRLYNGVGPYSSLDRFTAEYSPDNLVAVFSDHDDLILMGADTIEPWYNTGAADAPFVRNQGVVMEVGLLARNSISKIDNAFVWLGNAGERGGVTVWRADGYSPVRISTHALETQWEKVPEADLALSTSITMRIEGHEFYILTIPTSGTFVYDASTQLWCEWCKIGSNQLDIHGFTDSYGKKLVGSSIDGRIFSASIDVYTDDGDNIIREGITPVISGKNNELQNHEFIRIDMDTGVGLTSGYGSNPVITLRWAEEDGIEFSTPLSREIGKIGERRNRVYWRRLGQSRGRTYKFLLSDPVPTHIIGAYVRVKGLKW